MELYKSNIYFIKTMDREDVIIKPEALEGFGIHLHAYLHVFYG